MARGAELSRWAPAAVAALGVAVGGAGMLNGDAAAWVEQGQSCDVTARWTHVGYAALACLLSPAGDGLLRTLDAVSALAGAALVAATPPAGRGWAAAVVLPWIAFAEVDVLWMALVVAATRVASAAAAAGLLAAAVTVSPVAVAAAPWVAIERGERRVLLGPVAAVALLTAASGGDWWVGERGVLRGAYAPAASLVAWAGSGVWLGFLVARDRSLAALAPLVLAPPDVPAWVVVGAATARRWPSDRGWARGAMILGLVAGCWGLGERRARVAAEDRLLRAVAAAIEPGQVIEAPWSWGARFSVHATGRVYGARWIAVPPVRDQTRCPGRAVGRLPPGAGPAEWVDARGVRWTALACPGADLDGG